MNRLQSMLSPGFSNTFILPRAVALAHKERSVIDENHTRG